MQIKITEGDSVIVSDYIKRTSNYLETAVKEALGDENQNKTTFEDALLDKLEETNGSSPIKTSMTYKEIFEEAANTYGVDVNLLYAVARTESNFNPNDTSSSGAMGIMQLMPETAKELGVENPYDPYENVMGGAKLLSQHLKRYNGDVPSALAAYNKGPGNVNKYGSSVAQSYIDKVMGFYEAGVTAPDKSVSLMDRYSDEELMDALNQMLKEFPEHESFDEFTKKLSDILGEDKEDVIYSLTGQTDKESGFIDEDTRAGVTEDDSKKYRLLFTSANKAIMKMLEERDKNVVQ